jgi:hypothetical protein
VNSAAGMNAAAAATGMNAAAAASMSAAATAGMSAAAAAGMSAAAAAAVTTAAAVTAAARGNSYAVMAQPGLVFSVKDVEGRQANVRDFLLAQKNSPCVVQRRYARCRCGR